MKARAVARALCAKILEQATLVFYQLLNMMRMYAPFSHAHPRARHCKRTPRFRYYFRKMLKKEPIIMSKVENFRLLDRYSSSNIHFCADRKFLKSDKNQVLLLQVFWLTARVQLRVLS